MLHVSIFLANHHRALFWLILNYACWPIRPAQSHAWALFLKNRSAILYITHEHGGHNNVLHTFLCVAVTPVHDTPDAICVRQKHAPYIAQYTSLKDAIISLIDGKVRHEYDRLKVSAARGNVAAIAYYSTVPMVYL